MQGNRLRIEAINLHWLYEKEPVDVCAHGIVRVFHENEVVFEGEGDLTLSTAALNLLRTLTRDYQASGQWGGQLIPCCGNFMVIAPETGLVENCGCPTGVDWRITHRSGLVHIELSDERSIEVTEAEWADAVLNFSENVRSFYFRISRQPEPDDLEWHAAFVREWNSYHSLQ